MLNEIFAKMNSREKEIISNLRSSNQEIRDKQAKELFYGNGKDTAELRKQIKSVMRKCFSGAKYRDKQKEIYDTLVSLVWEDILKDSSKKLENAYNIPSYFWTLAKNCANNNRRYIHECIGIKDDEDLGPKNDKPNNDDDVHNDTLQVIIEDDSQIEEKPRELIAAELLNKYISKINRKEYRDIIIAIDINHWSHEKITRMLGIRPDDIDQFHRRAKLALTQAALPYIKKHCEAFFRRHSHLISPEDKTILERFFNYDDISKGTETAKAYMRLDKAVKKERKEAEREWRRAVREYKQQKKEFETTNNI